VFGTRVSWRQVGGRGFTLDNRFYRDYDSAKNTLSEQEQKLVWATQGVPKPDLFDANVGGTAWKSEPSWYIVGKKDHTVHPDLERAMAKRMGATTYELDSSHVPMLSQPERVIDVIRTAAKAVQGATVAA
jgi:pimeloyl-ACP methyl ester carboxylesterase